VKLLQLLFAHVYYSQPKFHHIFGITLRRGHSTQGGNKRGERVCADIAIDGVNGDAVRALYDFTCQNAMRGAGKVVHNTDPDGSVKHDRDKQKRYDSDLCKGQRISRCLPLALNECDRMRYVEGNKRGLRVDDDEHIVPYGYANKGQNRVNWASNLTQFASTKPNYSQHSKATKCVPSSFVQYTCYLWRSPFPGVSLVPSSSGSIFSLSPLDAACSP